MKVYTNVSRKSVEEDRVAICPIFGCENMIRVKPLKFRFIGFGKHPKCKKHHVSLVYVDERIGDFMDGALACFFDIAGLPPSELLTIIKSKFSDELELFVQGWLYCITVGRGAPIVSKYMDTISNAYLKQLTKKQIKALNKGENSKISIVNQTIKNGLDEISKQYTRLLKHLRVHSEILSGYGKLKPISKKLQKYLNQWQKNIIENNEILNSSENKREMSLREIKQCYDQISNVGTCRCLLGLNLERKELKKAKITAFDRFSTYYDFYTGNLTKKFTKSDVTSIVRNNSNYQKPKYKKSELSNFNEEIEELFNNNIEQVMEHQKVQKNNKMADMNERGCLSTGIESDLVDSIWTVSNDKQKIIYSIINENLDLNIKLNYVLFQKIIDFMQELENNHPFPLNKKDGTDSKGRKYISFQDPDFRGFKKMYYEGKALFAGLIYSIECVFPGFEDKVYVGLTIKDADKRFEEHVLNSIRIYLLTNGDTEQSGYGKLQKTIIDSLLCQFNIEKYYNQIKLYSNTYQFEKRRALLSEIMNYLKNKCFIIKTLEFHYSINSMDEREKYHIENYSHKGKIINTVKNGLNMNVGSGGPGKYLPIYEIAVLIALGQSIKDILKFLNQKYNLEEITLNMLTARIDTFFGGWYQAQEMFLKPIIEALVKEGFDRNAIYLHFKNLELGFGWFRNWSVGDVYLEYDIQNFKKSINIDFDRYPELLEEYIDQIEQYYCGISERQWLSYIFKGISIRSWKPDQTSISSLTKIGERKINTILVILFKKFRVSNKHELRYLLQKLKTIEVLKKGYLLLSSEEQNSIKIELKKENYYLTFCADVFNLSIGKFFKINECKKYFEEKLFKGKSVDDIFEEYYLKT